jgi:hypothetical protein
MTVFHLIDIQKIKLIYFIKMCDFDTLVVRKRTKLDVQITDMRMNLMEFYGSLIQ